MYVVDVVGRKDVLSPEQVTTGHDNQIVYTPPCHDYPSKQDNLSKGSLQNRKLSNTSEGAPKHLLTAKNATPTAKLKMVVRGSDKRSTSNWVLQTTGNQVSN